MSKNYVFYLNNSIIKQINANNEIRNIIFNYPHRIGKTDIVCFNFIINSNNISGSLSEFNNKICLNYSDGKTYFSDYFEYNDDIKLVRKSMIMNSRGEYTFEENIIGEEKYLQLERK